MPVPDDKPAPRRESLADPDDFILDLSTAPTHSPPQPPLETGNPKLETPKVPYLSIHFKCCNTYAQIRKTADGKAYAGHCPGCKRPIRVPIGPGGSNSRVFTAE